jgi:hypothetical protein
MGRRCPTQSLSVYTQGMRSFLSVLSHLLAAGDTARRSDLVVVLSGRPERKPYGLRLFREGLAPRLILSVGRFEVRQIASLGLKDLELPQLAQRTPVDQRHFFLDLIGDARRVVVAPLGGRGTFGELRSLVAYLHGEPLNSIAIVSTSIHLRRVRFCCSRLSFFRNKSVNYLAVPEDLSSFRHELWWKRRNDRFYVAKEYLKLCGYAVRYYAVGK